MPIQQFVTIFAITIAPFVLYYIYTILVVDKKYEEMVEAKAVRLEERSSIMYRGRYYVPIYKYIYHGIEYETESKYVRFRYWNPIDDSRIVRLKINPFDPYDVKEKNRLEVRQKMTHTKMDLLILIMVVLIGIIAFLVFMFSI